MDGAEIDDETALAEFAEACADDLDNLDDVDAWRDARWARKALDAIAFDALQRAKRLDRQAGGDWD